MTKRARNTTEEVLLAVDSDDEDDCDVDDPDEPFMDGSDEFSDLDGDDNNLDDNMDVSPSSPLGLPPEDTSAGASPPSSPASTSTSVPPM